MHIFPAQLMRMFDAEESLIAIGVPALETISLSFVFAGFCIVVGSVFQALGLQDDRVRGQTDVRAASGGKAFVLKR